MAYDYVVETRSLTKIYRDFWGRRKKTALNALDLQIRKGEIFGLLGPNGSGKTTTIKLLLGLLFPTTGEAFVFGQPAVDVRKNERIGYLPEESYLYRFLNAEETLDFYGRLFDIPTKVREERAADLIRRVGLETDKKRTLREYSKGMRQRIGLAQALINDPELVILDEPTSGLDPLGTIWMKELILALRDQGKTVLMCSHRLDDVQDVCDRIAILYNGDLQEFGEVKKLVEDAKRIEVRATNLQLTDSLRSDLEAVIAKHGGKLEAFGHPTTTLEDLFKRVVEESKARPGRRYLPPGSGAPQTDGAKRVDLPRVSATDKIHITVPVELRGVAAGAKGGGVLIQPLHDLHVECLVSARPDSIRVKIDDLQVGQAIHIRELQVPEGVKILHDPEQVVVQIKMPSIQPEVTVVAPVEGASAEPEVVMKKKEKEETEELPPGSGAPQSDGVKKSS
jgi:ABC-2 type transport system ATP-binding protein